MVPAVNCVTRSNSQLKEALHQQTSLPVHGVGCMHVCVVFQVRIRDRAHNMSLSVAGFTGLAFMRGTNIWQQACLLMLQEERENYSITGQHCFRFGLAHILWTGGGGPRPHVFSWLLIDD